MIAANIYYKTSSVESQRDEDLEVKKLITKVTYRQTIGLVFYFMLIRMIVFTVT